MLSRKLFITLLFSIAAFAAAAQSVNDSVARRALQVGHTMQQERVYVHFDNSAYYLGETIWFKAYVTYGTNDRPTSPSKVLYVELVAPEGYIVETKKYKIDENGCCDGEFELNPLLLSGYYEIRAYTRYMLNWGKEAVFSRVFPIFDKVNGDNWDFKNMLDRKRGFSYRGEWISAEETEPTLAFYPEGGNLVEGLTSNIAYELRGFDGEPTEATITIYADKQAIATTTPSHMGKGTFTLTPKSNIEYRAEVTLKNKDDKDKRFNFPLPAIEPIGATLTVQEKPQTFDFVISNNLSTEKELAFGILYRGALGYYKKFDSSEKNKTYSVEKDALPEGVNKAIIFHGRIPLAERCFFVLHDSLQKSDRSTVKLNVKSNGEQLSTLSLAPYEKIVLDITRDDGKPIPTTANLSLAVSDAAGNVSTSWSHNLHTWLLLGSELKGYIPDAAKYFDKENKKRKEQLNLLMLTNGWTAYDWSRLTEDSLGYIHPIERGITLKGKFFRKNRNTFKVGKGREVVLIPQKDNLTRFDIAYNGDAITSTTFRTDSAGEFIIETNDFYGKRIAALTPQITIKQNNNIKYSFALDRYFSPEFRLYDYWERNTGSPTEELLRDSLVQINPFEFLLSSVEVVSDRKREARERPPHSEMRFDYLDEWEYAQDVTYLREFRREDVVEKEIMEMIDREIIEATELEEEDKLKLYGDLGERESGEIVTVAATLEANQKKYIGNMRYTSLLDTGMTAPKFSQKDEYRNSITAADVVSSAMKRHNYNWAYWVQLMVVLGEYDSKKTPTPDDNYLEGKGDAEKMTNFKEFVIRSDQKTREQFENNLNYWTGKANKLDGLAPLQKFYLGFLSQHYVSNVPGVDGFPEAASFYNQLTVGLEQGISSPKHPNYVACMIPFTEKDEQTGIVPDLANSIGTMRYTSIQGYTESKRFYSPDYSHTKPSADKKDYRRTLLWQPKLQPTKDGGISVELYNSSNCNSIKVDIAGRDNRTFYSNDDVTVTRINNEERAQQQSTQAEQKGESDEDFMEKKMDPAVEKACEYEHNKAMIYYNQKRYKNAVMIWAELAKYNYAPALRYIAQCYKDGTGLKQNPAQVVRFYEDAARRGNPESQYELAMLYSSGYGCTVNDSLATVWLRRATLQKEPRAMVATAKKQLQSGEKAVAAKLYTEAAQIGNAEALYEYALFIKEYPEHKAENPGDVIDCMRNAATKGLQQAQIYIMQHEHEAQNYKEAYRWAKELSQAKRHEGTKLMADYYLNGWGVKRNKQLAADLYRTAAAEGSEEAAEIIKNM